MAIHDALALISLRFSGFTHVGRFDQVGMVASGDVGMRAETSLHVIQPYLAEQGVVRVALGAASMRRERRWQRQHLHGGVQARSEEKRCR